MPEIFLKFDPAIDGASTNFKFAKYIEVQSFSWGVANPPPDGKSDLPAVQQGLNIASQVDRQSPKLFEACAAGKHFETAELSVVSDGETQHVFYKLLVTDVFITSYQVGGAEAARPNESFTIAYRKVENEFVPQKADGSLEPEIRAAWDFAQAKG